MQQIHKSLAAIMLYVIGDRCKVWARRMDASIDNQTTKNSRELRRKLDNASKLASRIDEGKLRSITSSWPTTVALDWQQASRFERWLAKRALHRAAKNAHSLIALRALCELDHFTPLSLRPVITKARMDNEPQKIADFGMVGLPYLVNWICSDHSPP